MLVAQKVKEVTDSLFAITPTSIQQQSNAGWFSSNYMKMEIISLFIFYLEQHTKEAF